MTEKITGLELLRKPFDANQISKLPKPTAQQTALVKQDYKQGIRCALCGARHHPQVIHLDYVGHAALTDRLLDCDPAWKWEPFSLTTDGLPLIKNGELWIYLTVCGVTRPGVGDAGDKVGPNATKEMIGDALRNAAMRFGAALDLWHKGDLHIDDSTEEVPKTAPKTQLKPKLDNDIVQALRNAPNLDGLMVVWEGLTNQQRIDHAEIKDEVKKKLTPKDNFEDDIPC